MAEKTYIACRPGMKQAMEKAFDGVEVVVDNALASDYEFRTRELTGLEALEAELDTNERAQADPKNAHTFIVPVVTASDLLDGLEWEELNYLVIRVSDETSWISVRDSLVKVRLADDSIGSAISDLRATLQKDGHNVLSISEAEGLTLL